jgi:ubiquinone/menaquinone biosynthesis C-methylase UbiE
MLRFLREITEFGVHERDKWVDHHAKLVSPGAKVLDVGAGTCRYRDLFSHCKYQTQDFCQYESPEEVISPKMQKFQYGHIDYVSDATSIPVPDSSFDVVLCTEVLEHVPEPIKVVMEIARILKGGGRLLLTSPQGSGLHMEPYHFYGGYTPFWYKYYLAEVGFTDIQIVPNGGFFKHYGQESSRFSTFIHPRRFKGVKRMLMAIFWLLTLPVFRVLLPLVTIFLLLDSQKKISYMKNLKNILFTLLILKKHMRLTMQGSNKLKMSIFMIKV